MSRKLTQEEYLKLFEETGNPKEIEIIGEYKGMNYPIKYKTKDGEIKESKAIVILNWKVDTQVKRTQQEAHDHFMKRFEETENLENIKVIGKYINATTKIECECEKGHRFLKNPYDLLEYQRCPICHNTTLIKGINTFGDVHPDLVKYFKNKKDAYKYSPGSNAKVDLICPNCGAIQTKMLSEFKRIERVACEFCSDGYSQANKFISNIIKLRENILDKYIIEYRPQWENSNYRYDAYFEYNGEKYIVENQGIQHLKGWKDKEKASKEAIQENDRLKKELALRNGINHYIYFIAYKTDLDYFINEFEKTELKNIFNITEQEFVDIWNICNKGIFTRVIEAYNKDSERPLKEIANEFGIGQDTVGRYLRRGNKLGLCNYKGRNTYRTKVKAIDIKNNKEMIFESVLACLDYFVNKLNIKVSQTQLRRYIDGIKELEGYKFELLSKRTKRFKEDKYVPQKRRKAKIKHK